MAKEEIESSDFSPEAIEGFRKRYAEIDPAYGKTREARSGRASTFHDVVAKRASGVSVEGTGAAVIPDTEAFEHTTRAEAGIHGVDAHVDMGSSGDDRAAAHRAVGGYGMGSVTAGKRDAFAETRGTAAHKEGIFLLNVAGRCDHPRCEAIRARGLELMGATGNRMLGSEYEKANLPAIPSIEVKSGPQKGELRPADPNHPEWVAARKAAKNPREASLLMPTSLLQHHHRPGDDDFERYPLPWQ